MNQTNLKSILTKETLIDLYLVKKFSMKEISNMLGVKESAVHSYLTYYKINRNTDPRRKDLDKDTLYKLYVIEKKSKNEIMEILGCCKQTLDKNLKFYGITSQYMNFTDDQICKFYVEDTKSLSQISELTKFPKSRIRNILIKNGITLRDKISCQCININDGEKLTDFDFNILKSQSSLKRKCQSFFKNHISPKLKEKRGNVCEICGETQKLHVHHIKPLSLILSEIIKENEGKTDEELYNIIINDQRFLDESNLKVVCEKCHYTIFHPYVHYNANPQPLINNGQTTNCIQHPENNLDDDIV